MSNEQQRVMRFERELDRIFNELSQQDQALGELEARFDVASPSRPRRRRPLAAVRATALRV